MICDVFTIMKLDKQPHEINEHLDITKAFPEG